MKRPDPARIRDLCWNIGTSFPPTSSVARIGFLPVHPRQGFLHWNIPRQSVLDYEIRSARLLADGRFIVRVFDVTDIVFDGSNAHRWFDLDVGSLSGNYYLHIDRLERNFVAEAGFRMPDGEFLGFVRSAPIFFDRERACGRVDASGLLVDGKVSIMGEVENIYHARLYQELASAWANHPSPLSIGVVLLDAAVSTGPQRPLFDIVNELTDRLRRWGSEVSLFSPDPIGRENDPPSNLPGMVGLLSPSLTSSILINHRKSPINLINCHDWYSWPAAANAASQLGVPVILTLHSLECDRAGRNAPGRISQTVSALEQEAVDKSDLVIVPHDLLRERIVEVYGADREKIAIIPLGSAVAAQHNETKSASLSRFGVSGDRPVLAFIGEMSHAAGADLLIDALLQVFHELGDPLCILAGDGPLKGELEGRAWHGGIGERCRFVGHLAEHDCNLLLELCRFLVVPGRCRQDEGIAHRALELGKPVLTTHQSRMGCVVHGQNGLLAYDNKGSVIWGIKEMLGNSPGTGMARMAALGKSASAPSASLAAIQYLTRFLQVVERKTVNV